jgi:muconolactone delta-isomerase
MYGPQLIEMAQVAEQEHMHKAVVERARAQQRHEMQQLRGPGRFHRAWTAFWAAGDFGQVTRAAVSDGQSIDFTPCTDC